MAPRERTQRRFDMAEAMAMLSRTPGTLDAMLRSLPDDWSTANEGGDTWSAFDVVGHLTHADRTNWLPRARMILQQGTSQAFADFDRIGQVEASCGKRLAELLDEFADVRKASLAALTELRLTDADLDRHGRHPALGDVTLGQLLATWVVHDLDHLMQIARVIAGQYADAVGPWKTFLRIVRDPVA